MISIPQRIIFSKKRNLYWFSQIYETGNKILFIYRDYIYSAGGYRGNRPALRFQQHRNLRKHMFQEPEQIQVLGNAPGNQVNLFPFPQISSDRGLETLVVILLVPGFPCVRKLRAPLFCFQISNRFR